MPPAGRATRPIAECGMRNADWEAPSLRPGANPQSEIRNPQSKRVLIIEDNVDAAESLAELLKLWGHTVRLAHSGQTGIDAAVGYRSDVVLLDIGLPGMNGYEVAERLRQCPDLQTTCIVAVTGYGQDADVERARATGFDHHLTKPVDPERLRSLVGAL